MQNGKHKSILTISNCVTTILQILLRLQKA